MASDSYDLIIAGGGLAGGLVALAVRHAHPDARLLVVEAGDTLGGNHLWSCFPDDLSADERALVEPLFAHRWTGHDVRFPAHRRTLAGGYASIPSVHFDRVLRDWVGDDVQTGALIATVARDHVVLETGERIDGPVLDCRGVSDLAALTCGWQKFVGQTLRCATPHGMGRPVIMDATVDQIDGYRFVYLLPFSDTEIFVEDTYYSDTPTLDVAALRARIGDYAVAREWRTQVLHEETGVLPVVKGGDFNALWGDDGIAKAGVRAGLFQPLTSYSLPEAARFAVALASAWPMDAGKLHAFTRVYAARRWRANRFYRLLGKMLFDAAEPGQRYRVLEHFYRLPEPLIAGLYSGRSTLADKICVLSGKPQVPIGRAVRAILK